MQRISSNMTLVLKIFIPTFWSVFMLFLSGFIVFADPETAPFFSTILSKVIFLICVLIFGLIIYFTLFQLKRFEVSDDGFYISNYFKTYRYQYEDISSIKESNWLIFNTLKITMKTKTSLGKRFSVIYKKLYWEEFLTNNSSKFSHLNK